MPGLLVNTAALGGTNPEWGRNQASFRIARQQTRIRPGCSLGKYSNPQIRLAGGQVVNALYIFRRLLGYGRAFMASLSSTGMTTTANGVPASSLNCGSRLPNSLLPSIELS